MSRLTTNNLLEKSRRRSPRCGCPPLSLILSVVHIRGWVDVIKIWTDSGCQWRFYILTSPQKKCKPLWVVKGCLHWRQVKIGTESFKSGTVPILFFVKKYPFCFIGSYGPQTAKLWVSYHFSTGPYHLISVSVNDPCVICAVYINITNYVFLIPPCPQ